MQEKPVFIALIHGTWARNSAWPDEGSQLRRGLQDELRRPVHFHVPKWSGRNWQADRDRAAREVVSKLRDVWKDVDKGDRFLVCHSHGGNIGIRAVAEMREEVGGVICLNTPFISIMRRSLIWRLATLGFVLIGAPMMFLVSWLAERRGSVLQDLLYLGMLVVVSSLLFAFFGVLARRAKSQAEEIFKTLEPVRIARCPVLCVASADDEPSYGLSLLEALANLPAFLLHILTLPILLVVAVIIQMLGWVPPVDVGGLSAGIWASSFIYLVMLFIGLQIVGLGSAVLLRAVPLGLGFGIRQLLANLAVRVAITSVPLNARIVDFVDVDTGGQSPWAHSRIYEDEAAIKLIAEWIKNGGQFAAHA